jgi:N-acetylglucosaminyldiphosphoundecaprenol N-acetyl-beta-D-mannosaminyltransferase
MLTTFLNPYSYLFARKNIELFKSFNIKIDGIALVKVLHIFGFKKIKRESFDMTSLAPIVFSESISNNKSIYLIGTKPKVIDKAVFNIENTFDGINIIGFRDGYIDDLNKAIENILKLSPDIVICGMGTPLQEKFLIKLQQSGWNGIGYTCGGFLHQTAASVEYYPKWVDKYNIRWIYRIYDEPALFKRYFFEYPKFLYFFIIDYINYKRGQETILNLIAKRD